MNKKGILPLIALIPLILVGLLVLYFVFKAIVGLVIQAVMWTLVLGIIIFVIWLIYKLIKYMRKKK